VLEDIGLGNRMAHVVARLMVPGHGETELTSEFGRDSKQTSLAILGSEGMVMSFAKCCHPIPGDPIIGHISSGRGMVIHTESCNNVAEIRDNAEKCVSVRWDPNVEGEFAVEIRVELENERGIIAKLATTITGAEANIEKISTVERDARFSIVNLSLNVRNRIHLARVMKRIRLIKPVSKVSRVKSRKIVKAART
jgi:guanosine-3',5'-bis(diphosphate) 3'-pyrophosphohydrolase